MPTVIKWPGVIKPGTVINDFMSQEDWLPTLLAEAGVPDVKEKLKTGYQAGGKSFKVHLDGPIAHGTPGRHQDVSCGR